MVMSPASSGFGGSGRRPGQAAAGRDARVLIRVLAIALGCALFLGLVVLRG